MILISEETVVPALPKFMQTLDDTIFRELEKIAKKRGISIQELIRAVIVPEWVTGHNGCTHFHSHGSHNRAWVSIPSLRFRNAEFSSGISDFVQKPRIGSESLSLGECRVERNQAHLLENRSGPLRKRPGCDEILASQENRRCAHYAVG